MCIRDSARSGHLVRTPRPNTAAGGIANRLTGLGVDWPLLSGCHFGDRCSCALHWQRPQNALHPVAQRSSCRFAALATGTQRAACRCRVHQHTWSSSQSRWCSIHPVTTGKQGARKVSVIENQTCFPARPASQHRDEPAATRRGSLGHRFVAGT